MNCHECRREMDWHQCECLGANKKCKICGGLGYYYLCGCCDKIIKGGWND